MTTQATSTPATGAPVSESAAPAQTPAADAADAAGKQREIERLREQNRALKAEKDERDRKEKEAKDADLVKNQKFEELAAQHKADADAKDKQLQAMQGMQNGVYIDAELRARRYELLDPEDLALFDAKSLTVKDGEVQELDAKWAEFKKRKPHLFKPASATTTAKPNATHLGGSSTSTADPPDPKNMTPEQWEAYRNSFRKK